MALPPFARFTRPHTMAGTAISVISISLLALQSHGLANVHTQAAVVGLVQALVSALLMNVAIVGINQLYDIEIDKVRAGKGVRTRVCLHVRMLACTCECVLARACMYVSVSMRGHVCPSQCALISVQMGANDTHSALLTHTRTQSHTGEQAVPAFSIWRDDRAERH